MRTEIANLIDAVRRTYPNAANPIKLCDELVKALDINEQNLAIKLNLTEALRAAEEKAEVLQRENDGLRGLGYPIAASVGMTGIPAMSPECFRQNAMLAVVNGMLASGRWDNAPDLVSDALVSVDLLTRKLAK